MQETRFLSILIIQHDSDVISYQRNLSSTRPYTLG